jgi:Tfp pilus assembly protein PilZ
MTTSEASEQPREFPRYEVNAYVDYTGNEVLLFHRVENISLCGVCIQTSGVEEVGTIVDLVLNFPDLDATIAVRGEVMWANREPPMDMGIRYIELDEERKDTLRKYINLVRK